MKIIKGYCPYQEKEAVVTIDGISATVGEDSENKVIDGMIRCDYTRKTDCCGGKFCKMLSDMGYKPKGA